LLGELDLPEDDAPPEYVASNLRRCPHCGGMVYQWPCLACQLRSPTLRVGQADEESVHCQPSQPTEQRPTPYMAPTECGPTFTEDHPHAA
jgi:hypothetical protein